MANTVLSKVAETLGPIPASKRALAFETWTLDAETLFLQRWRELDATLLLAWLARAPIDDLARPSGAIVERIVQTSPKEAGAFLFLGFEQHVADVHDPNVRDMLVESYRAHVERPAWTRLTAHASGGPVFTAVRDCELPSLDGQAMPSVEGFVDGQAQCSLIDFLFVDRRDDAACLRRLKERAQDPASRVHTLWALHETKLLARVGSPAELLGDVPLFAEAELDQLPLVEMLMSFAKAWPDDEARQEWLVDRWTRAVERGVPWESLWWEVDPELRDEVALRSVKHTPLSLVLAAISRKWPGGEAWKHAMPIFQQTGRERHRSTSERLNRGFQLRSIRKQPTKEDVQEVFAAFDDLSVPAWVANTPLPEDADDAFLDAWIAIGKRYSNGLLFDAALVDRLLALPLTPSRAQRVLTLSLPEGQFWLLPRCVEIAEAVACAGVEVDVPLPSPLREPTFTAYKTLVGQDVAQRRVESALDELIETENLYGALEIVDLLRQQVDDARRSRLRALALNETLSSLASLRQTYPWLISEADVVNEAMKPGRPWGLVERLPAYLRPVITARAVMIREERETRSLLERLEALGAPRREILGFVLERIKQHGRHAIEPSWLAGKLNSRALWEEQGAEIVRAIFGTGDREGANTVLQLCFEVARSPNAQKLLPVLHTLLGELLTDLARRAILEGAVERAKSALSGLAQLSPASRLRERVRHLQSLSSDEEVKRLITVVSDLLRRGDGRDVPTLDAIHDALRELVLPAKEGSR